MKKFINEPHDIIRKLILGQTITIRFKYLTNLLETTGMIIKIDIKRKILHLPNLSIPFENIIQITT